VCGILGFRSFSFAFFQNLVFCFFLYFKLLLFFLPNEQSQLGVKLVDITLRAGIFFSFSYQEILQNKLTEIQIAFFSKSSSIIRFLT